MHYCLCALLHDQEKLKKRHFTVFDSDDKTILNPENLSWGVRIRISFIAIVCTIKIVMLSRHFIKSQGWENKIKKGPQATAVKIRKILLNCDFDSVLEHVLNDDPPPHLKRLSCLHKANQPTMCCYYDKGNSIKSSLFWEDPGRRSALPLINVEGLVQSSLSLCPGPLWWVFNVSKWLLLQHSSNIHELFAPIYMQRSAPSLRLLIPKSRSLVVECLSMMTELHKTEGHLRNCEVKHHQSLHLHDA